MIDEPSVPLLLTGASGTVGTAIGRALHTVGLGKAVAIGRTPPEPGVPAVRFWPVDLADTDAVAQLAARIVAGPPVRGLVCAAGLDSRTRLADFTTTAAATCTQVNAWAHVTLLTAALDSRAGATEAPLPVVLISSDVTTNRAADRAGNVAGAGTEGTLVYAAAKAAAEEAFRHAVADAPPPGMALLIVRLPDIGVPMRAATPGPPPPPRDGGLPRPVLGAAVDAVTSFISGPRPPLEVWNA